MTPEKLSKIEEEKLSRIYGQMIFLFVMFTVLLVVCLL